jgi:hypothetical protein
MKNALEEFVGELYEQLLGARAEFCACEQCRDDALAHALNHARPRYLGGSRVGAAVTRVALTQAPARAELSVLVLDAMNRVRANPRHGPEGFLRPEGGAT